MCCRCTVRRREYLSGPVIEDRGLTCQSRKSLKRLTPLVLIKMSKGGLLTFVVIKWSSMSFSVIGLHVISIHAPLHACETHSVLPSTKATRIVSSTAVAISSREEYGMHKFSTALEKCNYAAGTMTCAGTEPTYGYSWSVLRLWLEPLAPRVGRGWFFRRC